MASLRRKRIKWQTWGKKNPKKADRHQQMTIRKVMAKWDHVAVKDFNNSIEGTIFDNLKKIDDFIGKPVVIRINTNED